MSAKSIPLTVALLTVAVATASSASAQVLSYRHRSTVLGDHLAGYAEAVHAEGLAARNRAAAYQTWIQAERQREVLRQERRAAYHYEEQYKQQQTREKAEENRQRRQFEQQQLDQASQFLLEDVQTKRNVWPVALRQPEFAGYMLQVEAILRDWDAGYPSDRRALKLVAEDLQAEVADAKNVSFRDRVEAMVALKQLEHLASRRDLTPAGPAAGPQLARR